MQSLKTKYFPTSKKVEVVRQRCTIKNKIWSEIIYRVFVFEKLFSIPLRGASNNALLGLIKPPAMRVVTDIHYLFNRIKYSILESS